MKLLPLACVAAALSSPALAVDLSIDQTQAILAPDGKTQLVTCLKWSDDAQPKCEEKTGATIGTVIQKVLTEQLLDPSGRGQDPGNIKSGILAFHTYGKPSVTLSLDDIKLILARVDRSEDPVTVGRMHQFLEPEAKS